MTLPSKRRLQQAWVDLKDIHKEYLARHNVVLPKCERYDEKAKSIWLAVLWYYKDQEVGKDTISDIVQRDRPELGRDQQVRHLKRDGWSIGAKSGVHKLNPYEVSPEYLNMSLRKNVMIDATTFDEIKKHLGLSVLHAAPWRGDQMSDTAGRI